ncbi:unnamed protein product [Ectocarpus sp. CCAP 1310/34]|nr:unnamed protein product [Ectocarpus sp. CCAP 1310/34]
MDNDLIEQRLTTSLFLLSLPARYINEEPCCGNMTSTPETAMDFLAISD